MEPLLPVLLLSAPGAGAVWLLWRGERGRRARYRAVAEAHGLAYTARDDALARRFSGPPFGRGRARRVTHVLRGRWQGREAMAFSYRFLVPSGDGQTAQVHRFTVCALRLPAQVPWLEVTPATPLTRLAGALGVDEVRLESDDLTQRYRIRAEDRRFAYDVLHPRTIEQLLALPRLDLRLAGADALLWERGTCAPEELLDRLAALSRLVDGIPSYVWSDRAGTPDLTEGGGGAA